MEKLRIACIGAGTSLDARTSGFLNVINMLNDMYEHCAIMDLNEKNAQTAAAHFNIPQVYTNLEEMLEKARPDVVVRLTPTDSTTAVCVTAAQAGCHILNEIPIATTLPQADLIIETCRKNNVKLEVAENTWTWPRERLKQMIVQEGLIGEITHARLRYPCGSYHGFAPVRKLIGADPVRILGWEGRVPVINMISYGGEPMTETMWDGGLLKFPGHVHCIYEMPPKRPVWRHAWEIEGTKGYLAVVTGVDAISHNFQHGHALVLDDPETLRQLTDDPAKAAEAEHYYFIEWIYGERNGQKTLEAVRVNTKPPFVWENPYAKYGICDDDDVSKATYLESIYWAVVEDRPLVYGAENARRDQEIWIAIRESAWQGNRWIDLPLTQITSVEEALHAEFRRRYGCDPLTDIEAQLKVVYNRTPVMWTVLGWL